MSRSRSRSRESERGGDKGNDDANNFCVYVSQIPFSFGKEDLHGLFEKFGRIESCEIKRDPKTKESRYENILILLFPLKSLVVINNVFAFSPQRIRLS